MFQQGIWEKEINVRDFILANVTPYDGDGEFLAPPTERTTALWNQLSELMKTERERGGVYDIDEKPYRQSLPTPRDISTRNWSRLSACKPMNRSSVPSCRLEVSGWYILPSTLTEEQWILMSPMYLNTARPIMTGYLTLIPRT